MTNTAKTAIDWRVTHFSNDEGEHQELIDAIIFFADMVAEKRPDLVDGLMASLVPVEGWHN